MIRLSLIPVFLGTCFNFAGNNPPYPMSDYVLSMDVDPATRRQEAKASDNWPITWAEDGHQYSSFGDGTGFGTMGNCWKCPERASLGFSRIEGDWDSYRGINVWGGAEAENPDQFGGKSYGIISIGGKLYMHWGGNKDVDGSDGDFTEESRIGVSTDHSKTWTLADWKWTKANDQIYGGTFLNFGKDNAGARDHYVYSYFVGIPSDGTWGFQKPGLVFLSRTPRDQIMNFEHWEWHAGTDDSGDPKWGKRIGDKKPVFEEPNGVRVLAVAYNPGLKRYILTNNHNDNGGDLGVFESPEPWGPWKTIGYYDNWQNAKLTLQYNFAPKWWSADGKDFSLIYSDNDSWISIRGSFSVKTSDP
jgi:hypothetical protein